MKCTWSATAAVAALCALLVWGANASRSAGALVNSWENDAEGWSVFQSAYSSAGFSTTTGVTDQTYRWGITGGSAGPDYSSFMGGPSTLALTTLLGTASTISVDVTVPTGGDFGWFMQWSAWINNTDTGFQSIDNYSYSQSPNVGSSTAKTLTWTLPAGYRNTLATSTNPTSIGFLIGGGSNGGTNNTFYVDNLRTTPVPEPAVGAMLAAGAAALATLRRRR